MADTRSIRAAQVNYPWKAKGLGAQKCVPGAADVTALSWYAGTPVINYSGNTGKAGIAAVDGSDFITNANKLLGFTKEPFDGSKYAAAVNGMHQTHVIVDMLVPGVPVEVNLYHDGDDDADDALTQALLFGTVTIKQHSGGFWVADGTTAAGTNAVFNVVKLVDPVGTYYGRIMVEPAVAYLFRGYATIA